MAPPFASPLRSASPQPRRPPAPPRTSGVFGPDGPFGPTASSARTAPSSGVLGAKPPREPDLHPRRTAAASFRAGCSDLPERGTRGGHQHRGGQLRRRIDHRRAGPQPGPGRVRHQRSRRGAAWNRSRCATTVSTCASGFPRVAPGTPVPTCGWRAGRAELLIKAAAADMAIGPAIARSRIISGRVT